VQFMQIMILQLSLIQIYANYDPLKISFKFMDHRNFNLKSKKITKLECLVTTCTPVLAKYKQRCAPL